MDQHSKNQADSFCYESEKRMNDLGDNITPDQKETNTNLITEIRSYISTDDFNAEELKTKMTNLSQSMAQFANTETNTTDTDNSVEEVNFAEE